MKIVILAGDTDGNIGDRAIVFATCEELRRLDPGGAITIASGRPAIDREFFGATTVRRGFRGLPELLIAVRRSDLVLCGGGGLFQDDASLVKMPYWALRLLLVRSVARRVAGYALGVGPLRRGISRAAARLAFACLAEISVRDERARTVAQPLTGRPVRLVPDPALLLSPAPAADADRLLASIGFSDSRTPTIGVAARRWFHLRAAVIPHKWAMRYRLRPIPGETECERMTTLLAAVLDHVAESHDARVLFLPTYNAAHEGDDEISTRVMAKLRRARSAIARIEDPRLYKAVTGRLRVLLGSRMHPTIFAAAMGTPVVGLSYNPKFEGFFELIGRRDRVIAVDEFVAQEMTSELAALVGRGIDEGPAVPAQIPVLAEMIRSYTAELIAGCARSASARPSVRAKRRAPSARAGV